jgi:predicted transglutaminase-like cysteine proteinase
MNDDSRSSRVLSPVAVKFAWRWRALISAPGGGRGGAWRGVSAGSVGLLLAGLLLVLTLAALAATDFGKILGLAQQRYGQRGADTVTAWQRLIEDARALPDADKLAKVNTFFNRRSLYETDLVIWQQEDYWETPLEFMGRGTGDCEDFAIAKYMTLQILGVGNEHLRLIYVRAKTGATAAVAHMVLGYFPQPTDEPLILDNLITSVRPASQRSDLVPVFSFNSDGLWTAGATASSADPTARLSRWRDVLDRMRADGF